MKESKTPGKKRSRKSHSARQVGAKLEVGHRPQRGPRHLRSIGPAAEQGGRSVNPGEGLVPAPWETCLHPIGAGAAPEPIHSRRPRKWVQTTARKSAAFTDRCWEMNE